MRRKGRSSSKVTNCRNISSRRSVCSWWRRNRETIHFLRAAAPDRWKNRAMSLTHGLHRALQQQPNAIATVFGSRRRTYSGLADRVARLAAALRTLGVRGSGSDVGGVFYSGGTTGFPKGVMLSHGGMFSNALAGLAEGMVPEDCAMLHIAPMFHLADIFLINMGLVGGARHVIVPTFEPLLALQTIQAETISELGLVPLMLQLVVDHPRASEYDLSSVRQVLYGAAPISETVLDRALEAMPAARFYQAFGQAEVSP